jgi:hypothetical protein
MKRQRRVQCNGTTRPGSSSAVLHGMRHRRNARHGERGCGINIGPTALADFPGKSTAGRPAASTPVAVAHAT